MAFIVYRMAMWVLFVLSSFTIPTLVHDVRAAEQIPYVTLNNGVRMPQFGLGTYLLDESSGEAYNAVLTALKMGYRHIDTAHAYGNERSEGEQYGIVIYLVKKFGLHRSYGQMNMEKALLRPPLIECSNDWV